MFSLNAPCIILESYSFCLSRAQFSFHLYITYSLYYYDIKCALGSVLQQQTRQQQKKKEKQEWWNGVYTNIMYKCVRISVACRNSIKHFFFYKKILNSIHIKMYFFTYFFFKFKSLFGESEKLWIGKYSNLKICTAKYKVACYCCLSGWPLLFINSGKQRITNCVTELHIKLSVINDIGSRYLSCFRSVWPFLWYSLIYYYNL